MINYNKMISTELATSIAAMVAPFLPFLKGLVKSTTEKSFEEIGKQAGGSVFEHAKRVWDKLFPKIAENEAVTELQKNIQDDDLKKAFDIAAFEKNKIILTSFIEKISKSDPLFIEELKSLHQEAMKENANQPFNDAFGIHIKSQVAKIINVIGQAQNVTFNQS